MTVERGVGRHVRSLPMLVIALPPLAVFVFVGGFFAAEAVGLRPLSSEPANLSEAVAIGAAARALQLIAAGEDPNQRHPIGEGVLGSISYQVDAIDAAILGRRPEMIPVLLEHGAAVTDLQRSVCLVRALSYPEVLPLIGAPPEHLERDPSEDVNDALRACLGMPSEPAQ
jgi:hypothetical protein